MSDCEKGMNKLKAAKAMVSMCYRSCSPAPSRRRLLHCGISIPA